MKSFLSITKAMADENRLRILMFLAHGELCVCQIIEMLGLAPSTVSKHLSILHQAGLVESRKNGRWIYYRLPSQDAPEYVKKTISLINFAPRDEDQILRDSEHLVAVCQTDKEKLCDRYKN